MVKEKKKHYIWVYGSGVAAARVLPDRAAAPYKDIYWQRTCTECINAQATDLGIERPKVRIEAALRTLNTLTYILINLRALLRVRAAKEQ